MGDGTIVPFRRRPDLNRLIATLLQHSRVLAGEAIWHPDDFAAAAWGLVVTINATSHSRDADPVSDLRRALAHCEDAIAALTEWRDALRDRVCEEWFGPSPLADPVAERFFDALAAEHVDLWEEAPGPSGHATTPTRSIACSPGGASRPSSEGQVRNS